MNTYKKIIEKCKYIWRCYRGLYNKDFYNYVMSDNKKTFFIYKNIPDNDTKNTIYDIRTDGKKSGFFAIYRWILNALYVADRFGMIPGITVTDTFYTDSKDENFFDIFFEFKDKGISHELCSNIIQFNTDHLLWMENEFNQDTSLLCGYTDDVPYLKKLATLKNKYITIKSDLLKRISSDLPEQIKQKRTIGIHYRGTDFKGGFINHPVVLSPSDYYPYINECIEKGYESIFIATDDENALNEFSEKYPGLVTYYKDVRRSNDNKSVHESVSERNNDSFLKGYEVLRDMITLSKCNALICGKSQVSIAARIEKYSLDSDFDYFHLIDKGNYSKDTRKKYYQKIG